MPKKICSYVFWFYQLQRHSRVPMEQNVKLTTTECETGGDLNDMEHPSTDITSYQGVVRNSIYLTMKRIDI